MGEEEIVCAGVLHGDTPTQRANRGRESPHLIRVDDSDRPLCPIDRGATLYSREMVNNTLEADVRGHE